MNASAVSYIGGNYLYLDIMINSAVQCNTVQYSTVQYTTVQYSTV